MVTARFRSGYLDNAALNMLRTTQLWLSPRPVRRTNTAGKAQLMSAGDAALFEFLRAEDGKWFVRETHYIDNPIVKAGLSGPPL